MLCSCIERITKAGNTGWKPYLPLHSGNYSCIVTNKFLFFLISKILPKKKTISCKKTLSSQKLQREKNKKTANIKKRVYKHLKEITRCESPSLRPIKQSTNKHGKQLIPWTFHILKRAIIALPPNTPHEAQWCQIPNVRWKLPQPISLSKEMI